MATVSHLVVLTRMIVNRHQAASAAPTCFRPRANTADTFRMYVRGSDQDYDDWAALVGDESWSSKHMKEYMKKHQTLEPIDDSVTDRDTMPFVGENHGTSGPVRTSFNDWRLPLEDDVIKACDEATGMTKKPMDPWSGDHIGFFNTLGSVVRSGPDRGKRSYAARGYLNQAQNRPNLKVLCEALVSRVVLEGNVVKGVNFMHGGAQHTVPVNKEVIVCCGTIQSPQILELSGIGDPKVLGAAGVECKVELPGVGNNLQDHDVAGAGYEVAPGIPTLDAIYIPDVMADAQKQLMEKQAGPLTAISSTQGFFPYKMFATDEELKETVQSIRDTANASDDFQKRQLELVIAHLESSKSANLQFVLVAATGDFEHGVEDQSKLFPTPAEPGKNMGVTMAICLQYPVSRGSVHITSSGMDSNIFPPSLLPQIFFPDCSQPGAPVNGMLTAFLSPPSSRSVRATGHRPGLSQAPSRRRGVGHGTEVHRHRGQDEAAARQVR